MRQATFFDTQFSHLIYELRINWRGGNYSKFISSLNYLSTVLPPLPAILPWKFSQSQRCPPILENLGVPGLEGGDLVNMPQKLIGKLKAFCSCHRLGIDWVLCAAKKYLCSE